MHKSVMAVLLAMGVAVVAWAQEDTFEEPGGMANEDALPGIDAFDPGIGDDFTPGPDDGPEFSAAGLFDILDANGDGAIDQQEWAQGVQQGLVQP